MLLELSVCLVESVTVVWSIVTKVVGTELDCNGEVTLGPLTGIDVVLLKFVAAVPDVLGDVDRVDNVPLLPDSTTETEVVAVLVFGVNVVLSEVTFGLAVCSGVVGGLNTGVVGTREVESELLIARDGVWLSGKLTVVAVTLAVLVVDEETTAVDVDGLVEDANALGLCTP